MSCKCGIGNRRLRLTHWLTQQVSKQKEAGAMKGGSRAESGAAALFEDPDFPTEDKSLFSDNSTPIAGLHEDITWRRPQVWMPRKFLVCFFLLSLVYMDVVKMIWLFKYFLICNYLAQRNFQMHHLIVKYILQVVVQHIKYICNF